MPLNAVLEAAHLTENRRSIRVMLPCLSLTDTTTVPRFSAVTGWASFSSQTPGAFGRNEGARFSPGADRPRGGRTRSDAQAGVFHQPLQSPEVFPAAPAPIKTVIALTGKVILAQHAAVADRVAAARDVLAGAR